MSSSVFLLRSLMVSFVFSSDLYNFKSHIGKNDVINCYNFGHKNGVFGDQKLNYRLEILYTVRRL